MPTAFCSLEDAYGDWNRKPVQQNHQKNHQQYHQQNTKESDINVKFENVSDDTRNFCPNCKSCLKANDELQQKVINQIVWPRPRWMPQIPDAYVPYDPYNRYWTNVYPVNGREDFGNSNESNQGNVDVDLLLKVILFVLSVLFVVQLVEIFSRSE